MHLSIVVNQLSNYHAVPKLYFVNKVTVQISDICQLRLSALAKHFSKSSHWFRARFGFQEYLGVPHRVPAARGDCAVGF